ncbi:MAG: gliding motility-associated C-terminal domain-containing protein [Ferruginibacter sp.]
MRKRMLIWLIGSMAVCLNPLSAQNPCNAIGQNPGTAFPVCGTSTFSITSVPICGGRQVPGPCNNVPLNDKNPYWYKFKCFNAGTLGFVITPNTLSDDYDWQIFDVTGRNPADVYADPKLFVCCNWSGDGGLTGASAAGTKAAFCDGPGVPRFSSMPNLIKDHEYILLVSHFSDSQSGYSLSFGGGTANITDPVNPNLANATAACDGAKIRVKLNKKMKCSSIAPDGSDFSLSTTIATITGAAGIGCTNAFDMDSVEITLSNNLPPGNYAVSIATGTDNNNLLDNCDREIPAGQSLPVTVYPVVATPMDSLTKVGCAPAVLELVFRTPMLCSSIAADGSDFIIIGSPGVTIASASGICQGGNLTSVVQVRLSAPILASGNYLLRLQSGSDGNTIINECGVQTPAGSARNFSTVDTVSALFNSTIRFGCKTDHVDYTHDGRHNVNSWRWSFDSTINSRAKDTSIAYTTFGQRQATLIVSNGACSDTATSVVMLDNNVEADFQAMAVICPGDPALFTDTSTGPVISWNWSFGNGNTSSVKNPPQQIYPYTNINQDMPVRLIVKNNIGCADTAYKFLKVVANCYIAIPKAFSPNSDGRNDFLYPTNAYKAKDLVFRVYNRNGQKIFETRDWTNKWDGSFKGNPQDPGAYVWILTYTNIDTGKRIELKGSTILIR